MNIKDNTLLDNNNSKLSVNYVQTPIASLTNSEDYNVIRLRAEKLSAAIHLITEYFENSEPLRILLRQKSLNLLSLTFQISTKDTSHNYDNGKIFDLCSESVLETLSMLGVANSSEIISPMNFKVLHTEYLKFLKMIESRKENFLEFSLPKDFFNIEQEQKDISSQPLSYLSEKPAIDKRHDLDENDSLKRQDIKRTNFKIIAQKSFRKSSNINNSKRKEIIIDLIKKSSKPLSIKDIAKLVEGCSEKTIQRELVNLIKSKTITRHGDRRWSTYSLI